MKEQLKSSIIIMLFASAFSAPAQTAFLDYAKKMDAASAFGADTADISSPPTNPAQERENDTGLEGMFGIKFGKVMSALEHCETNNVGELAYEFHPQIPFRGYTEYILFATPITRQVSQVRAVCIIDDEDEVDDEINATVKRLEAKFGKESHEIGDTRILLFDNGDMILVRKEDAGFRHIIRIDSICSKLRELTKNEVAQAEESNFAKDARTLNLFPKIEEGDDKIYRIDTVFGVTFGETFAMGHNQRKIDAGAWLYDHAPNGPFVDCEDFFVYGTTKSKKVFMVRAVYDGGNDTDATRHYDWIKRLVERETGREFLDDDAKGKNKSCSMQFRDVLITLEKNWLHDDVILDFVRISLYLQNEQEHKEQESSEISAGTAGCGSPSKDTETYDDGIQLWAGGPYWAETNVGAETPWERGLYFWWGDTVGYRREGNSWVASDGSSLNFSFDVDNTPTYEKDISELQREGWIVAKDGTYVLAPEHDAGHIHCGGLWRMPTLKELEDLENKCDWTSATTNGVDGYIVSGRGDYASFSVFLPATGGAYETSLTDDAESTGLYWSSVPCSHLAGYLYFGACGHGAYDNGYRYQGFPVRPVQRFAERKARQAAIAWKGESKSIPISDSVSIQLRSVPGNLWFGQYEVTQAQWAAVMGENPSRFKGADNPVEEVSWNDCQEFLAKFNALPAVKKSGLTFRLPTEEEWEYACRAGATGDYCKLANGTEITRDTLGQVAWFDGNSDDKTHPVGQKQPNAFGLYDMHGNVWEWTSTADGVIRVDRGGGWSGPAGCCESSNRFGFSPDTPGEILGFRLCASGKAD